MRKSAWYMTFLSAAALAGTVGCGDSGVDPCAPGSGLICPDDAGTDAEVAPPDTGPMPDRPPMPMGTCGDVGRTGGLCRDGVCFTGLQCIEELAVGAGAQLTARNTFDIGQAMPEDASNETFVAVTTPVPANDVPITYATGSLCTEQCSTAQGAAVTCDPCAKCTGQIGNDTIGIGVLPFIPTAMRTFGADTGLCRADCSFDLEGRGMGCPTGYSCDPFTNVCLEACRNDAQCQATLVVTEDGEYGTWLIPDSGRTCNMTTGRCDWTGPAEAHVGDACDGQADCRTDTGFCLRGGTCAQTQCNRTDIPPGDTMADFTCDGGRGVCLGTGGNMGAVCIQGCNTSDDCNPGNACQPLGDAAGPFTGYCFGLCDTVPSGGTDELVACRADERCDMPAATAEEMDPDGTCRPSCDPAADPSECETDEVCEAVTGETYGFCRALGSFCFNPGTEDCANGQVCDNELGTSTFGRCVDPCTADTDCTVAPATTCVTDAASSLAGLCAETCVGGSTTCGEGRICRVAAGSTDGYCVDMP